ncbi:hypothetical protein ACI6Q2_08900 [Chitinophagaceae bacterium LWZ2-11]
MKIISYVFFKLIEYYKDQNNITRQKLYAFIGVAALVMFNLLTIRNIVSVLCNLNIEMFGLTENEYLNRFVIIPLIVSPIFIILWVVYKKNKIKIEEFLIYFTTITKDEKKKLNTIFWLYVISTGLLLILSTILPVFIKH